MSNVVQLKVKGGKRLDAQNAILAAARRNPKEVITIEEGQDGGIELFASRGMSYADILWFLENAKLALLADEV